MSADIHPAPARRASTREREDREQLLEQAYVELRVLAERFMRRERRDHTLEPTALLHEALLRIVSPIDVPFRNRPQFFGAAARAMRQVLIEHARRRSAAKRSAARRVPLTDVADAPRENVLARLDEATARLAAFDPQLARLVELRFFGGFTVPQIAAILSMSPRTVKREWRIAKGWLHRELARSGSDGA